MIKKSLLVAFLVLFCATSSFAFDLVDVPLLKEGEARLSLGGQILYGAISPQISFSVNPSLNGAKVYEENLKFARGLGSDNLRDMYIEVESKTFQSRQETVSGALVHAADKGWLINVRSGGNFIHTDNWILGGWFHAGSPILIDKQKFVNPVANYFGVGLNSVIHFSEVWGFSQSAFVGSGLFLPRRRNPNVQGSMLLLLNLGKMMGSNDFILRAGGEAEYDLTSRIDAAYQASTLGDGRIRNMIFMTPFLADFSLGENWNVNGGYAMKWIGRSLRGTKFILFNLSRNF